LSVLLLHIESSGPVCSLGLSESGKCIDVIQNASTHAHAEWIHIGIEELFKKNHKILNQLHAIAVSIGPGSYTGLRIGLSTAKGLCYGLKIPLIPIDSLKLMAIAARAKSVCDTYIICQDAGRMEIYAAVYNYNLITLNEPRAIDLAQTDFFNSITGLSLCVCGSGSAKALPNIQNIKSIIKLHEDIIQPHASDMIEIAHDMYNHNQWSADYSNLEPAYLKPYFFKPKWS
jgi:tRNA threonylcarbamoyladenosine biosynthesis protein TsaB